MATSVSRIQAQIAKLQQQADALKQAAVKRVQREIELHGLTADDLFGGGVVGNGRKVRSTKAGKTAGAKAKAPKYGDSAGNTWGGMGKRPQWLKDALEQGASLEDFLLGGAAKPSRPTVKRAQKAKVASGPAAKGTRKKLAAKRSPAKRKAKSTVEQSDSPASE